MRIAWLLPLHLKDKSKCLLQFLARVHSLQAACHLPLKEGEEMAACYNHQAISNVSCVCPVRVCIVWRFFLISFVSFGYCNHKFPFQGGKMHSEERNLLLRKITYIRHFVQTVREPGKQWFPKYMGSLERFTFSHRLGTYMQAVRLLLLPSLFSVCLTAEAINLKI